jgi:hypothetical protein
MGTRGELMRGVLPLLVFGLVVLIKEIFVLPLLFWSAQDKIFFSSSYTTFFNSFVPIAQQAGQAVVPRRLSLYISFCAYHK